MKVVAGGSPRLAKLLLAVAVILLAAGAVDATWAQGSPFGMPRPQSAPPPPTTGMFGWIFAKQAEFYRALSGAIRAAKADGSAAWTLFGISFLYGMFHAAGPGHGKAVISSYLVANEETWKRGVVLSFASALLQALVAVAIVGIAAALLNVSSPTMATAVRWIEIVSYALIILIGLRLLWVKGRAFVGALQTIHRPAAVGAAVTPAHHHGHDHSDDHAHGHHDHGQAHQPHAHDHSHDGNGQDDHAHDDLPTAPNNVRYRGRSTPAHGACKVIMRVLSLGRSLQQLSPGAWSIEFAPAARRAAFETAGGRAGGVGSNRTIFEVFKFEV